MDQSANADDEKPNLTALKSLQCLVPPQGCVPGDSAPPALCATSLGRRPLASVTSRYPGLARRRRNLQPASHDWTLPNTPTSHHRNYQDEAIQPSLNSEPGCIKVVDTFRPVPDSIQLLGLAGDHQGCVSYGFVTG